MIYVYLVLLIVYFTEYPRTIKSLGVERSELLGQFACHLLMLSASAAVVFLYYHSYDIFYLAISLEYSIALVILAFFGVVAGLGGIIILIRGYLNPKHRF